MNLSVWVHSAVLMKSLANTIALLKEVCDLDKEVTLRVEELVDLRGLQKYSCCLT
ncbi:MAG: hypothetical protein WCI64_00410 [Chlorobium sp.]